jgi:heme oxygenase
LTTTDQQSTSERFSDVIRTATFSDHETAAMSGFMTALFEERLPLEAYTSMVAQHYFAYVVLEQAADALADHPVAGPFVVEELRRVPSLEADLAHLLGAGWRDRITSSAATTAYAERMTEVCFDQPEALVAHHYTRYMGDLSGGQMIGRIARRAYALEPGAGAAFYEFPGIDDLTAFKDGYRVKLDEAAWSADERDRLLAEIIVAYRLNTEVFTELDADLANTPIVVPESE